MIPPPVFDNYIIPNIGGGIYFFSGLHRLRRKEENDIAIFHCPIQIIKRSVGRSAVAAAAYRSGERLTNEWDGKTHDYTHKPGIVHKEIMLPAHAPPEFQDRSTLWNSVEQIEKASDAQLAREIEVALPVELSRAEQLALVRAFVKDNFVAAGMCADFALHDKGDGNPHAHILLTIRPLRSDGKWGPKCRKVYDLDSQGNRIPDGKGGWKNHLPADQQPHGAAVSGGRFGDGEGTGAAGSKEPGD